jgi:carboxyl-terminal processing protease
MGKGKQHMKMNRMITAGVLVSSLACNFIMRAFSDATPTAEVPVLAIPTPAYIPPQCLGQPLATMSPEIALAEPTPFLETDPEIPVDLQTNVFNEVVDVVQEVYVYPDFNGQDWNGIVAKYRGKVESGLNTLDFYTEMKSMIFELGDEHSYFETPLEVAASEAELAGEGEYVGIGIYILPMIEKGSVSIISVFPDSPAEYSGLKPHDSILAMDGIPVVRDGRERTEMILGPECSALVLTVQSPGEAPRDIMLVRQQIRSHQNIEAQLLPTSDGSRVGYIFLPTFFDQTIPGQVREALENFGELDGLILDNRMNGGGSSEVVQPILSYFVSGTLGRFISRDESRALTIEADPIHNSQTVPLIILVGEDTVSFGEIFSGALRDVGRAQVVGSPTLGNVEILHGYNLDDGSRLWIAEESFQPVNSSENWELTGIVPDAIAYADWDTFTFETDPAIPAALKLLGH